MEAPGPAEFRASDQADRQAAPSRVLIANLNGLLLELVRQLVQQQPDLQLVGEVQGPLDTLMAAGPMVDVLILGTAQPHYLPGLGSHLLVEYPNLKILALAANGETASFYWLGLRQQKLRKVSTTSLSRWLRQAPNLNPAR